MTGQAAHTGRGAKRWGGLFAFYAAGVQASPATRAYLAQAMQHGVQLRFLRRQTHAAASALRAVGARVFSLQGLARTARAMTSAGARRRLAQAAVGFGAVAVIVAGAPALQETIDAQRADNAWRLKARAFLASDPVAPATPLAERYFAAQEKADRLSIAALQSFAPAHFDHAERKNAEHECLSRAIYYEAGFEPQAGKLAVAEVVFNRVRHPHYPNTVCDVVYQGSHRVTGCQFTFTCDGSETEAPRGRAWRRAQLVAAHAQMGLSTPLTQEATHYHADYVDPYWAPSLVPTRTIGAHIFYRMPRSGERPGGA